MQHFGIEKVVSFCLEKTWEPSSVVQLTNFQSWASPQVSPQIRNCRLTKKVVDLRTLAV